MKGYGRPDIGFGEVEIRGCWVRRVERGIQDEIVTDVKAPNEAIESRRWVGPAVCVEL